MPAPLAALGPLPPGADGTTTVDNLRLAVYATANPDGQLSNISIDVLFPSGGRTRAFWGDNGHLGLDATDSGVTVFDEAAAQPIWNASTLAAEGFYRPDHDTATTFADAAGELLLGDWQIQIENDSDTVQADFLRCSLYLTVGGVEYRYDVLPFSVPPAHLHNTSDYTKYPAVGSITVPAADADVRIARVDVGFYLTHSFRSDLQISLIGPDATTVMITTAGVGGSWGGGFGTSTADADLCVITDYSLVKFVNIGTASGNAKYTPEAAMNAFVGKDLTGSWQLKFFDQYSADQGTVLAAVLFITAVDGTVYRAPTSTALPLVLPDDETTSGSTFFSPIALPATPLNISATLHGDDGSISLDLREQNLDTVPDQPETITPSFIENWQGEPLTPGAVPGEDITVPAQHIGNKRPKQLIMVRNGRFNRDYRYWNDMAMPVGAQVGASAGNRPWQATWHANNDYRELENVMQVDLGKNFDENGVQTATIQVANIMYPENAGGGHDVRRGYMSPLRGYDPPSLPSWDPPLDVDGSPTTANEWSTLFDDKVQVTIYQTYGDAPWVKVFSGLVDDIDSTSRPDIITLTCRDFGEALVDSKIFGWNKDPRIKGPVIFVGHDEAFSITESAYDASASSSIDGHDPGEGLDDDKRSYWRSNDVGSSDFTEWFEFRVSEGFYEDIWLDPRFLIGGSYVGNYDDLYISVYPHRMKNGDWPTVDGTAVTPGTWYDNGSGTVPGDNGGIPYVHHTSSITAATKRTLGSRFELGQGSVIRVSFRGLPELDAGNYAAGVRNAFGYKEKIDPDAAKQHWVIVDDISDVVKVLLRWAGFKEWEVESTGAALPRRLTFQPGDSYMDAIRTVADAVGYTFFVKDPTTWSGSLGVPVFRKSWALVNRNRRLTITDRTALTGIAIKQSEEELRYTIRTRGRADDKGSDLGFATAKRIMFFFRPPWIGSSFPWAGKLGGIIKHAIYTNALWKTMDLCRFAAYDIALKEAMAATTGTVEFAGNPAVDLDEHVLFSDLGTGAVTRLAIYSRASTFVTGENAKWTMSVSGSLIDTPDVQAMVAIINEEVND